MKDIKSPKAKSRVNTGLALDPILVYGTKGTL